MTLTASAIHPNRPSISVAARAVWGLAGVVLTAAALVTISTWVDSA